MQLLLLAALLLPQGYAELFARGQSRLEAGHPREARADLEAALALRPENANCAYALACTFSAAGDLPQAGRWLKTAADWGYDDPAVAAWDPDLDALRKSPAWKELLGAIEARFRARPKPELAPSFDWGFGSYASELSPDKTRLLVGRGGPGYLFSLRDRELLSVLSRDGKGTEWMRFTPDGRHVVRSRWESALEVWDGSTGEFEHELEGPGLGGGGFVCSRDGTRVIGFGGGPGLDSGVKVWELATGKLLHSLPIRFPTALALSPDAKRALVVQEALRGPTVVGLWDLENGKQLARHEDCGRPMFVSAFSDDGALAFAMSSERGRIVVYDGKSGAELRTIDDGGKPVSFPRFVPGQHTLAFKCMSGELRWVDAGDGSVQRTLPIGGPAWGLATVDPSGRSILVDRSHDPWDGGTRVQVLDEHTGGLLWERDRLDDISMLGGASFSVDGELLVLTSYRDRVEIVESRTGRIATELASPARELHVQAGSDPEACLVAPLGGPLRRIELSSGRTLASRPLGGAGASSVSASGDGQRLLVVYTDGKASIFSGTTLEPICDLDTGTERKTRRDLEARFSPDGEHLATWHYDDSFDTWSARSGARELHAQLENARISDIDWSHDGRLLALADANGSVQLIETSTGAASGPRIHFPAAVLVVRFSPVEDRFVVGGENPVALVFEPGSDKPLFELSHKPEDIFGGLEIGDAVYTPNGSCVVTTTQSGGDVIAWDMKDGHRIWTSSCGGGNPVPLYGRFDRTGTRLCNYGQTRGSPRVFDAKTGALLVDLGPRDYAWLDFSADGKRLLASKGDSLQVLQAADGALLYERVEMAEGDALLRTGSMHVEGSPAALRHVQVLYGGASYPLDGFAPLLLDARRVRAAAAGVHVAPALLPELPRLVLDSTKPGELVARAACAAGLLGFEVELDGEAWEPARVAAATHLEQPGASATLELSGADLPTAGEHRLRVCAIARSGISSRPGFASLRGSSK